MMSVSVRHSRFVPQLLTLLATIALPAVAAAQSADPPPAAPAPAAAQSEPASFWSDTEFGGLLDLYYDYYSTRPGPGENAQFRNFDTKHNQFNFNMGELWVAKAPSADSRVGFKVRSTFGSAAELVNAFEPGGPGFMKHIEEGYISYLAPAGKGLQIDVGKFTTPIGAEVIEAKDNWNYSRSLLFALAIPYYHTGLRLTYAPTSKVSVAGFLVNGWNNVVENNAGKTFGGQVSVKPNGSLSIVQNFMAGPEQTDNDDDWRQLSDTIVTFTVSPMVSLMANYDYGHDTVAGTGVNWQGIAGYAKIQANKVVAITPRFEWYDDSDGFTTGTSQKLKEATVTLEAKATDNLLWRVEYRGDFSNEDVFKDHNGDFKDAQHSIGISMLYSFSAKGK